MPNSRNCQLTISTMTISYLTLEDSAIHLIWSAVMDQK